MPDDQSAGPLGLAPSMPDLAGTHYHAVLARLHEILRPRSYLEIGVETGATLALARCPSIGIDPAFRFTDMELMDRITAKPSLLLYKMASDAFFAEHSPTTLLGRPLEMAFLDGMHRCEYLLRDFINTEIHCRPNAVVALHDCVPLEMPMAERVQGADSVDPPPPLHVDGRCVADRAAPAPGAAGPGDHRAGFGTHRAGADQQP